MPSGSCTLKLSLQNPSQPTTWNSTRSVLLAGKGNACHHFSLAVGVSDCRVQKPLLQSTFKLHCSLPGQGLGPLPLAANVAAIVMLQLQGGRCKQELWGRGRLCREIWRL